MVHDKSGVFTGLQDHNLLALYITISVAQTSPQPLFKRNSTEPLISSRLISTMQWLGIKLLGLFLQDIKKLTIKYLLNT